VNLISFDGRQFFLHQPDIGFDLFEDVLGLTVLRLSLLHLGNHL
jgi:hypothetical protein